MATYWVKSGAAGTDAGTSWANAAESIPGLMTAQALAAGDIIYVHNTHSYNAGAGITWTLPESGAGFVYVYCVDGGDATGASLVDGTVGVLTTGAIETTGGNFLFTIQGQAIVYGMAIRAGAGGNSSAADISFLTNGTNLQFTDCTFWVNSTNSGALVNIGTIGTTVGLAVSFKSCIFRIEHATAPISCAGGYAEFIECSFDSAGATSASVFKTVVGTRFILICSGCDWREATNVVDIASASQFYARLSNCVIGTPTTGTNTQYAPYDIEFHACAAVNAGAEPKANILNFYREDSFGVCEYDSTIYLTTGSASGEQSDGTDTPYSIKMTPFASCTKSTPMYSPWVYVLVGTTGDKTITMKVADSESAILKTSQLWMEVQYMGEPGVAGTQRIADSPHAVIEVDDDCPIVTGTIDRDMIAAGTNRTDTAVAWTGITETDTYTLTASVNCAEVGYIRCRVGLGVDTTNPVYVDPKVTVA